MKKSTLALAALLATLTAAPIVSVYADDAKPADAASTDGSASSSDEAPADDTAPTDDSKSH
jgi:hypothetical protein